MRLAYFAKCVILFKKDFNIIIIIIGPKKDARLIWVKFPPPVEKSAYGPELKTNWYRLLIDTDNTLARGNLGSRCRDVKGQQVPHFIHASHSVMEFHVKSDFDPFINRS